MSDLGFPARDRAGAAAPQAGETPSARSSQRRPHSRGQEGAPLSPEVRLPRERVALEGRRPPQAVGRRRSARVEHVQVGIAPIYASDVYLPKWRVEAAVLICVKAQQNTAPFTYIILQSFYLRRRRRSRRHHCFSVTYHEASPTTNGRVNSIPMVSRKLYCVNNPINQDIPIFVSPASHVS